MTRQQFEKLQLKSLVVMNTSGAEVRVEGVDEADGTFMDHCGGWHHFSEAEAPEYVA